MKSRSSHASTATAAPLVQASPLSGFKFSSIGQPPSLLDRIRSPSPDQELSQGQASSSFSLVRRGVSQSITTGVPHVEHDVPMNSDLTQPQSNSPALTPVSSTPESYDAKFSQSCGPRPTSVIPDLQYPNVASESNYGPSSAEQSTYMDQDLFPSRQPSVSRNSVVSPGGGGLSNGVANGQDPSSSTVLQRSVEDLIKLTALREERISKQRDIFNHRSGETCTFSFNASQSTKTMQERTESVKLQAEQLRVQAGQMLQEANKTRELADQLIVYIETLNEEMPTARQHVDHMVERSEQMTSFMRKNFDWLAIMRGREQEKVEAIQAGLEQTIEDSKRLVRMEEQHRREAEQLKEAARREEEEREAARKKAEEVEAARKKAEEENEAARKKVEEENEAARKKAEEENEAARKKAEEENEAARKKAFEAQRATVMAQKRMANEAHAQSIQAERERRLADVSGSGSNAPPTVLPGFTSERTHNSPPSNSLTSPPVVPGPPRSPARGTATALPAQPPPSPNKSRTVPAPGWFVPAQTEVGRTVKTDSPLSSTTLASELRPRIVEASQRPSYNQPTYTSARDQVTRHSPTLEQRRVEIKREPSMEVIPTRLQAPPSLPSPETADMDEVRQHPAILLRTPSQDRNSDQRNQASSRPASRAHSLYVAPTENRRLSDPSAPVPSEQASLIHSRDSPHDHVVEDTGYTRHNSICSDQSPRWHDRDRRSRSPIPRRFPSRSPSPYSRKRVRSGTPHYDSRQAPDHWNAQRQWRTRDDWPERERGRDRDRDRQFYGYDHERRGDSPHRYRPPPPRRAADTYRPSPPSPVPPSPRQYRHERVSPGPGYRDRSYSPYDTQRFVGLDAHDKGSERINTNARHYEPTYEAGVRHNIEEWRRPTPSSSDRDRTPTPPPRLAETEVDLLDRIDMNEAEDRGRRRGRQPPGAGVSRGGPNPRRGVRGGVSSGRGRGAAPTLLKRMTGTTTTTRGIRPAQPSLSDRMQQD